MPVRFLAPGISKNKRLYTRENIADGVTRLRARLASGTGPPVTMFPSHPNDTHRNTLETVGRLSSVEQRSDGSAWGTFDIPDTTAGRDLDALLPSEGDRGFVRTCSILGSWVGSPTEDSNGVVTAPGLDIHSVDLTHFPGVSAAEIDPEEAARMLVGAGILAESAVEGVFMDPQELVGEAGDAPGDGSKPYGNVTYADPGYQKDKKKRYPIDTAGHARAAWAYISKGKNAAKYTASQLARIKSKIKRACKRFGITTESLEEEWTLLYESALATLQDLQESYVSVSLGTNMASISVSGYPNDPSELPQVANRMALAAIAALYQIDPDNDGDIDLEADTDDDDMEATSAATCSKCGDEITPETATFCPWCGQPVPQAESSAPTSKEPTVAEETTGATGAATEQAPAPITLTDEQFKQLLAAAHGNAPASAAPAAPAEETTPPEPAPTTTETAPAGTVTLEQAKAMAEAAATAAVEQLRASATKDFRAPGGAGRKGYLSRLAEEAASIDPLKGGERTQADLAKLSNSDLQRETDAAFLPLLDAAYQR